MLKFDTTAVVAQREHDSGKETESEWENVNNFQRKCKQAHSMLQTCRVFELIAAQEQHVGNK